MESLCCELATHVPELWKKYKFNLQKYLNNPIARTIIKSEMSLEDRHLNFGIWDHNGNVNCIGCENCYMCVDCLSCTACFVCDNCVKCTSCKQCKHCAFAVSSDKCVHSNNIHKRKRADWETPETEIDSDSDSEELLNVYESDLEDESIL